MTTGDDTGAIARSDDDGVDARIARLERRLARERAAREEAERIAERGMRDLWHTNRDLEGRVAERTAELERSLGAVTMAAQAKERFLAELGHELATPLHAVLGLLELTDRSTLPPQDRERLTEVRRHADELAGLLRGLVELAGAEGRSSPEDAVAQRPADWLDDVVTTWTLPAAKRGQLLVPSTTGPGAPVGLDWRRLRRIVDAVLSNVVQHANPGSVEIGLHRDDANVTVTVHDSGPGMSPEQVATAMEPFVGHGDSRGIGIGLAVAHRLATGDDGIPDRHQRRCVDHRRGVAAHPHHPLSAAASGRPRRPADRVGTTHAKVSCSGRSAMVQCAGAASSGGVRPVVPARDGCRPGGRLTSTRAVGMCHHQFRAGARDLPAGLMTQLMVAMAEQHAVLVAGRTVLEPFDDVVGIAPRGPDGAPGPAAPLIASHQCIEQIVGHQPCLVTEIENRRTRPGDHPVDAGVAGQLAHRGRIERGPDVGDTTHRCRARRWSRTERWPATSCSTGRL